MGIPAFFRWLSKKYPSIVVSADKEFDHGYNFDNFYLDMNGIIHPCTHPENKPAPESEEEMFEAIFEYIDMLMNMIKPSKILYLAVDGVAPRAKMNQQRSRRFRAVKESADKKIALEQIKDELKMKGVVFDNVEKKSHFDSNVITPGTPFMYNLSIALRNWIDQKLKNVQEEYTEAERNGKKELDWPKDLIVILSDASVPGEGEHKIIDFIRKQKAQKDYNPNIKHCLCGADADLIMLGLATHELDFTILREEFIYNQPKACEICNQYGHDVKECQGVANIPNPNLIKNTSTSFLFIRLCVLREYLQKECDDLDFERYIDDFVFLCFFVGNDFLPHLPSLEIREGAIDKLLRIYKELMSQYSHPKPYMTENGFVNLHKVQTILKEFGKMEDDIFYRRKLNDERYKSRLQKQKMLDHKALNSTWLAPVPIVKRGEEPEKLINVKQEAVNLLQETSSKVKLNAMLNPDTQEKNDDKEEKSEEKEKNISEEKVDSDEEDEVQLWNEGWKERYYLNKFDCSDFEKVSQVVAEEYVKGLCWVMRYYYQGCQDWEWYFPFHYAPFASDFKNIENFKVVFNKDAKPFKPLEQLMSVFPIASNQSLPDTWKSLMSSTDSNIVDFYPLNFRIDLNGKKQAWQGVALLPFIDETRLFKALEKVYPDLTAFEIERNELGSNLIFVSKKNEKLNDSIDAQLNAGNEDIVIEPESVHGTQGTFKPSEKFTNNTLNSICLEYYDPIYDKEFVFLAKKLSNAKQPEPVLKHEDFQDKFHRRNYNNQYNNYKNNSSNNYSNNSSNNYSNNYKPVIGFNRRNDQASISNAGHRMINFYNNSSTNQNLSNPTNFTPNYNDYSTINSYQSVNPNPNPYYQNNTIRNQGNFQNSYQQPNRPNYRSYNQTNFQNNYQSNQFNYQPNIRSNPRFNYQQNNQGNFQNRNYVRRENLNYQTNSNNQQPNNYQVNYNFNKNNDNSNYDKQ